MHSQRDTDQIKSTASLTKIILKYSGSSTKTFFDHTVVSTQLLLKQTGPSGVGVKSAGSVLFVAICV